MINSEHDFVNDGIEKIASPLQCEIKEQPSTATLESGFKFACELHNWMEKHEDGFMAILGYVKRLQMEGTMARPRERVVVFCVDHDVHSETSEYKFSNSLWAGIERYMVLLDPTLRNNPLRLHVSAIDHYGLLPVSYLNLEVDNGC